jgi:hypothetical protein
MPIRFTNLFKRLTAALASRNPEIIDFVEKSHDSENRVMKAQYLKTG